MASLLYSKRGCWHELVIGVNKKVLFVNPDDLQIYKEIVLDDNLSKCDFRDPAPSDNVKKSTSKPPVDPPIVRNIALSNDGLCLAVACSGQKALLLYECRPESVKLLSVRNLVRTSSALTFSSNGKFLLVTDKAGDCYFFDCEKLEEPGKVIFGHISIVYDIVLTPNENFVITCDRDDKIRVSNFPNSYDIETYCLGHREFVSAIKVLPTDSNVLISISGDQTVKLWNYRRGLKLADFKLPSAGIKCAVREVSENVSHLAVALHEPIGTVIVCEIVKDEDGMLQISEASKHTFDSMVITNICYVDQRLFVVGAKNERFVIDVCGEGKEKLAEVLTMITDHFSNEAFKAEDVSFWFRKVYDNVSAYYDRKRRRLADKCVQIGGTSVEAISMPLLEDGDEE